MGAVAERLVDRAAAAAQRKGGLAGQVVLVAVGVDQFDGAFGSFHAKGPVFPGGDFDVAMMFSLLQVASLSPIVGVLDVGAKLDLLTVAKMLQYFGTEGSTSSDQARMPPFRFQILRKPALRRKSTASAERLPLRQCATISRELSSSWTRRGRSPSGIRWPLRLQIWYSCGSRTSRMKRSSPRSRRAFSSRGVISGMPVVAGSLLAAHTAEFFVVDQFIDGAMLAADRAIGILAQPQFAEAHAQRIEQQQAGRRAARPCRESA